MPRLAALGTGKLVGSLEAGISCGWFRCVFGFFWLVLSQKWGQNVETLTAVDRALATVDRWLPGFPAGRRRAPAVPRGRPCLWVCPPRHCRTEPCSCSQSALK